MKRLYSFTFTFLLTVALTSFNVYAEEVVPHDPRVAKALEKEYIKFIPRPTGEYGMKLELKDGRTQKVFVHSKTDPFGKEEIRLIYSIAYLGTEPPPRKVMELMLRENATTGLGHWQFVDENEKVIAVFSFPVPADFDPASLKQFLFSVAMTTDNMEKELSDKDEM